MKHIVILLALLIGAPGVLRAQTSDASPAADTPAKQRSSFAFGVYFGALASTHGGGFTFPGEQPPVITYDEGSGVGPAFGIRADIRLLSSLSLSPRLFAECRRGTFISDPFVMEIVGQNMQPQDMRLEDELDVTVRLAGLDLLVQWHPLPFDLYLAAGPSIGLKLYEEFTVTERILEPDGVTFLDGSRSREIHSGDPDRTRALHAGVRAGAGYMLRLGNDLAAGTEVLYLVPLQTVTEEDDWSMQALQATLSLLFRF